MASVDSKTTYLVIKTPEKSFFEGPVEEVVLETPTGQIGILPGHMAMTAAVIAGPMAYKLNGKLKYAFLSEGFVEVSADKVSILADTAEWPEEIDINRAKRAEERARERLQGQLSHEEYIASKAAIQRAFARLKVSQMKTID